MQQHQRQQLLLQQQQQQQQDEAGIPCCMNGICAAQMKIKTHFVLLF